MRTFCRQLPYSTFLSLDQSCCAGHTATPPCPPTFCPSFSFAYPALSLFPLSHYLLTIVAMLGHHLCLSIVLWLSFFRAGLAWTPHRQCTSAQATKLRKWMAEAKSIFHRGANTLAEVIDDYEHLKKLQPPYTELFTALLGPQPNPTDWRDFYGKSNNRQSRNVF
jgi:hypothetical protein